MAKAPRPGAGARAEVAHFAEQILILRVGEQEWRLAWRNVPMGERMLVRKWTGLPYSTFTSGQETIDQDSLALLWCLARRAEGEKTLIFSDDVVAEWEALLVTGELDISVEEPDETADDPEV